MISTFYLFKDTLNAPEVPKRDKYILLVIILLIISPFDFIPDFLLPIGIFDDIVLISIFFDYFFNYLDRDLLLQNWPKGLKSFNFIYRIGKVIASISPKRIVRKMWLYKPSPY